MNETFLSYMLLRYLITHKVKLFYKMDNNCYFINVGDFQKFNRYAYNLYKNQNRIRDYMEMNFQMVLIGYREYLEYNEKDLEYFEVVEK